MTESAPALGSRLFLEQVLPQRTAQAVMSPEEAVQELTQEDDMARVVPTVGCNTCAKELLPGQYRVLRKHLLLLHRRPRLAPYIDKRI